MALTLVLAAGASHADTCTALKLKAIGKKEQGLLTCHSKVAIKGDPSLLAPCILKVEAKFDAAFGEAGTCGGDPAVCDCLAQNCATAIRTDLPDAGPSKCEAARLKAAAKKAAGKLTCNFKAALKGISVDPLCIQKVEARYQTAFAKVTGCSGDQNTVESDVNQQCVSSVGADTTGGVTVGTICASCTAVTTTTTLGVGTTTTTMTSCISLCPLAATWDSAGSGDGQFSAPEGIAVDGSGNVFVGDTNNHRIQKLTNTGAFLTRWGSAGSGDGQFVGVIAVAVDGSGDVFAADNGNNVVQKFTDTGTFLAKWGGGGSADGQFNNPLGVGVDGSGNVFVADALNDRIQKFTSTGSFLAQWPVFDYPDGLALDASGNVFVVGFGYNEFNQSYVQKFTNTGTSLTAWATFGGNQGVAVDGSGNVYVASSASNSVLKFTNTGTLLGTLGCGTDGLFNAPFGVAVDGSENVFVTDPGNNRVQKFACP